ncbi:MAG: hypothetical protein ABI548_28940 [Polyangiaceae bacterium]
MSPETSELLLFVDNEQQLYNQKMLIFRALARKKDRGVYNPKLAPKAFAALLTTAAKKYMQDFGSPGDRWNVTFPTTARQHAAEACAAEFVDWYEVDYQSLKKPPGRSN